MNRNKLILYIGGFELPDKNAAAHRVIANSKAFRNLGYEVSLIGVSKEYNQNLGVWIDSESYGFRYFLKTYPQSLKDWINYVSNPAEEIKFIRDHKEELEGVILYNHYAVASLKIRSVCREFNIPVYGDCTEWYSHKKTSLLGIIKHLDSEIRMRVVQKSLDGIIVISQYLYDYYNRVTPTVIVPPLVDYSDEKWKKSKENVNGKSDEELCLLYAGSPGDRKDRLDLMVSAVQDCDFPIILKIIGITEKDFQRKYPSLKIAKNKSILFLGRLQHNEVLTHLITADYTCFFRDETRVSKAGFPTKFVESITAGIPVITNKTSDIEIYSNKIGGCILLDDLLPSSIEDGLKYAYKNRARISNPSVFDYHNYLEEFLKLFDRNQ